MVKLNGLALASPKSAVKPPKSKGPGKANRRVGVG